MEIESRRRREDIKRHGVGGFGAWKTIMTPTDDGSGRYTERNGQGFRPVVNPMENRPGVYEIQAIPPKNVNVNQTPVVIYLGKAGGPNNKETLKTRFNNYLRDGSHKGDVYDVLLKNGFVIQARTKPVTVSTRSTSEGDAVKKLESYYLERIDYIANKQENHKYRYKDVKISKDKTLADALLEERKIKAVRWKETGAAERQTLRTFVDDRRHHRESPAAAAARTMVRARARDSPTKQPIEKPTPNALYPGPVTKDGTPDMRYKQNKEKYGKASYVSAMGDVARPLRKDGHYDMRYAVNKNLASYHYPPPPSSSSYPFYSSPPPPCPFDSPAPYGYYFDPYTYRYYPHPSYTPFYSYYSSHVSSATTHHTTTTTTTNTRVTHTPPPAIPKDRYATRPSAPSPHLKKDGTPDMRYKENKTTPIRPRDVSVEYIDNPLRKDGKPDMRYRVNKTSSPAAPKKAPVSSTATATASASRPTSTGSSTPSYSSYTDYGKSRLGSYSGLDFDIPLTNSGSPDMRFSINKDLFG